MSKAPSKYDPLSQRLRSHEGDEWRANFSDLEQVLGFPLPKGAKARSWWANDPDKGHSRSWGEHGWEVGDIDPSAETVVFRRGAASAATIQKVAGLEPLAEGVKVEPPEPVAAPSPPAAMPVSEGAPPVPAEAAQSEPKPKLDKTMVGALVAGSVAVVAGLGALAVRGFMRRR